VVLFLVAVGLAVASDRLGSRPWTRSTGWPDSSAPVCSSTSWSRSGAPRSS